MYVVHFYRTPTGNPVIQEWLRDFDKPDRAILGFDLKRIQFGFPMGLPLCRSLGDGLWEVRSTLTDRREARMIFFHDRANRSLVVVHGFIKKSQKTPKAEIDIALRRMKERSL
ncbi:type II toxin-antitoxin system RelE/ParE family toxin [Brevundimonas sp. GCM10030266]|uniref:type II toxin-antitoxin system RelE/ParE family toxin n=1 Tax=Brevundimonas sp. GCM10030266 TaxID=3273386 RepID=UPI00360DF4B7